MKIDNYINYWRYLILKESMDLDENLTIPQNEEDKIESELYKNLEKNYDHADRIVRWYRNAKKDDVEENELKKIFIDNLVNIKDLFQTYDSYIESLKKMKMLNKKVKIENGDKTLEFDPVKDIDKIRRLEGFQKVVKAIGDTVHSGTSIQTSNQKYAITDEDRKNIRLLGYTEHVMCWSTKGYDTTNKFIFQLWQNSKTLGRGDVYGDPTEQTPYCTHSKEHWDDYSDGDPNYEQYWFLKKIDNNLKYVNGDLTNTNVVQVFKSMKGKGKDLLIAMNDSDGDFLNKYDEEFDSFDELDYGNEVKNLDRYIRDQISKKYNDKVNEILLKSGSVIKENTISISLKKMITSITIPENVTEIGDDAFHGCTSLTSITIPESVTEIGDGAFWYCESLNSITIPESVTKIGFNAFYGCKSLTSIIIPDSVTYIGQSAFMDCTSLISISIPENVTEIGQGAFQYCHSLTSITIPESVTKIGYDAFYNCTSLISISIPENVTEIGYEVFSHCTSLTSITIPESVTEIGYSAFSFCESLSSITIPENVTVIEKYAFRGCKSLTSITIPDSVTEIGYGAFYNCTYLKSVIFSPNSRLKEKLNDENELELWGLKKEQIKISNENESYQVLDIIDKRRL